MRTIIFSVVIWLFITSCINEDKTNDISEKQTQIKTEVNYNVETLGLIYSLADSNLIYSDFAGSAHLTKYYLAKFEHHKTHPSVIKMKELLEKENFYSSCVTEGLFFTEFPEFKPHYSIDYSDRDTNELLIFYDLARDFYKDADLENFFSENKEVYLKMEQEVRKSLPERSSEYISIMEKFHGIAMSDYVIIPSLFIPNYFNFGPMIRTEKGIINYFVLGAASDIEINNKLDLTKSLGYDNPEHISSLGVHEFGHTFMRFLDKKENSHLVEEISYLNTSELQDVIYPQGYGTWKGIFEEHLVRTCEIYIAGEMNNMELSKSLYDEYVNDRGFEYIPYILELLPDYMNNRDKYEKFEFFLPVIIKRLDELKNNQAQQNV